MKLKLFFVFLMLSNLGNTIAQDTTAYRVSVSQSEVKYKTTGIIKASNFYLPAAIIAYGIWSQNSISSQRWDLVVHNKVVPTDRSKKVTIDNYLQFAPGIITIGMTAAGIKGDQNLRDAAITYVITNIMLNATVIPVKHYAHRQRPDSSDFSSFPSGHTTEAFANAEFMRMQYGKKYPWIAVAGYLMAGTTGYLRIYNNKHWFSDVIAGAAIGFCSARLAGWMYTRLQPKIFPSNNKTKGKITSVTPVF